MKIFKLIPLFIILSVILWAALPIESPNCREIILEMLDSIKKIKTEEFKIKASERINENLIFAESQIKINFNPKKIYFNSPISGIEMLWVEGTNKGNALIHTRTLPFMNLDLDPYGSIMRKDEHHTIFELGTPFIGNIVAKTILQSPKDFDKHFKYAGMIKWNNTDCFQVIIEYPEYKYIEYTTLKGESVTSISEKLNTSDFKIRYKNDLSSYFGTIKEGKKLFIPIPYSNKVIMYIDIHTSIPVKVMVYDETGLFEDYEFYNIKINPSFAPDEFSKHFEGYGF